MLSANACSPLSSAAALWTSSPSTGFPCQLFFFFSFFFSLKAGPVSKQEFTSLLQLLLELRGLKQIRKHFWEQPLGRDREHPDLLTSHQLHLVLQEDAGLEGNRSWCLYFAPQICRAPAQPGATPRGCAVGLHLCIYIWLQRASKVPGGGKAVQEAEPAAPLLISFSPELLQGPRPQAPSSPSLRAVKKDAQTLFSH